MKRILLGCFLCAAISVQAEASGYSDFNAGVAARNNKDPDGAIRYLTQALAAPDLPSHLRATALLDRAESYALLRQFDPAIVDLDAALALGPSYTAFQDRGYLRLQKKQFDLARADYLSAIALRPELANAYVGHGMVNLAERNYDGAIKDYTDALGATLGALDLYVMRGDAYRAAGRYGEAIKDYGVAIGKDKKYLDAWIARGRAYQESGSFRDALSDFNDALDLAPKNASLHQLAGIVQWELGRYGDAAGNFAKSGGTTEQSNYAFLWTYLANRAPAGAALAANAATLDLRAWPGPMVKLVLGMATADEVFAAARQGDADAQEAKTCEADFFVGEWQHLQGNGVEGKRLLGEASQACRNEWPESRAAKTELQRLE